MAMYWGKDNFEHERRARIEAERALSENQKTENIRDAAIILSVIVVLGAMLWTGPRRKPEVARAATAATASFGSSGSMLPTEHAEAK